MPRIALRQFSFYYRVNGEKAEQLLQKYGKEGDFLLRYSESNPQNFSISVRVRDGRVLHVKVTKYPNDILSIYDDPEKSPSFGSITELLEFYMEFPEKLIQKNGSSLALKQPITIPYHDEPCVEEQRRTQLNRWWHGNLPASSANQLLQSEKTGTFLVRASQHIPGALVISAKTEGHVVHLTLYQDPISGKFNIDGDRTKFMHAWLLIDSYAKNPIVEKGESSRVVYMETPRFDTFVQADLFVDRYEILRRPLNPKESMEKTGISEEFDRLGNEQVANEQLLSKREGRRPMHALKNRYKNIVPFDHTRVILRDRPPLPGNDYINASYVRFENSQRTKNVTFACEKSFIATQGCLDNTIADFWYMVWQENSHVIAMPTMEKERTEKCSRYWPPVGTPVQYGDICVTCTEERRIHPEISEDLRKELDVEKATRLAKGLTPEPELDGDGSYIMRTMAIRKGKKGESGGEIREVKHLQYLTWPDHGCPPHPYAVLHFLENVDSAYDEFNAQQPEGTTQGPIVVHCSAGIGRTGAILVLDALLTQVKNIGLMCPVDVYKMIKYVRTYRSGMVQTEQQYAFLYKALAFYLRVNNPYPVKTFINVDASTFESPRRLRPMPGNRPSSARQVGTSRPASSASTRTATSHSRPRTAPQDEPMDCDEPSTSGIPPPTSSLLYPKKK